MRKMILPAALALCLLPGAARAQSAGLGVELRYGTGSSSGRLGVSTGPSEGYFGLGQVEGARVYGLGVLFPDLLMGIQPRALVAWSPAADLDGSWFPCEPGLPCEAVLLPVEGRASRLEATIGAQVPLFSAFGPARPFATVGVGLRRYGLSWGAIGEAGEAAHLEAGSFAATDFLLRVGAGLAVGLAGFEATIEGSAGMSEFGAGRVPVPEELLALWAEPTIDLGRQEIREYRLTVGLRRYFD